MDIQDSENASEVNLVQPVNTPFKTEVPLLGKTIEVREEHP